jgi:hypothetical protein
LIPPPDEARGAGEAALAGMVVPVGEMVQAGDVVPLVVPAQAGEAAPVPVGEPVFPSDELTAVGEPVSVAAVDALEGDGVEFSGEGVGVGVTVLLSPSLEGDACVATAKAKLGTSLAAWSAARSLTIVDRCAYSLNGNCESAWTEVNRAMF